MDDWGVRFWEEGCGGGGIGSRPCKGGGRGLMLSPLGRDRMLGSMERFALKSGIDGVLGFGAKGGGLRAASPVPGLPPLRN